MASTRCDRKAAVQFPWAVVLLACLAVAASITLTHTGSSTAQETLGGKSAPAQKGIGSEKAGRQGKADGKGKAAGKSKDKGKTDGNGRAKHVDAETKAAKAAAKAAKAGKGKAGKAAKPGATKSAKDKTGGGAAKAKCPAGQIFDKRSKGCL